MTGSLRDAPPEVDRLRVGDVEPGTEGRRLVRVGEDALGRSLCVPVLIARGLHSGPVVGLTAAVHGNELNGVPAIHRLFQTLDPEALHGTVVGVPIVNIPAYLSRKRTLPEGVDLNRLMPGDERGSLGRQYAFHLRTRVIEHLDDLVDLHTASFGRVNALYVRADLTHPVARRMALWQGAEIVVHNEAGDGTLRGAAMAAGIPAITVEVGDPQRFQRRLIRGSVSGLSNVLAGLGLFPGHAPEATDAPVVCGRSRWIHAQHGGLLEVFPSVGDPVAKGAPLARVTSVFGDIVAEYTAPEAGVVVGKSTDPVCESGARVLHLGIPSTLDAIPLRSP
jgi:hypothetical protein